MPYGTYPSYPANTDPDLVQYLEALKRAIADVAVTGTLVVRKNSGADVGTRPRLNFIEGSNVTLTVADDAGGDEIDITIDAALAGGTISGSGTSGTIAKFTGAASIGDSIITESGATATVTGTLNATTALQVNGTAVSVTGHVHDASAITSGTLAVARGGTGTGTAPTQYGVIYAASASSYTSTLAASTGALLYSPDGTSWAPLAISVANRVLRSNGTIPSWGTITSSYTTGTFPPDAHAYDTHTGAVPVEDLDDAAPQAIFRADTAGTAWEVYQGTVVGRVLKLTTAATNAVWAEGQVAASEITGGTALSRTSDTNVTLTLGGAPTTALLTATSLTLGWTGSLSADRGGTGLTEATIDVGDVLYSPDGDSWDGLGIGGANTVLRSNGTIPSWGTITSAYTTGTFPPDSHAYDVHTGTVPIADLGGFAPQGVIRAAHDGLSWETHQGTVTGRVLKLQDLGGDNDVWAEGQVAASEITNGAALSRTSDTNVTLTLGGSPTTSLLVATSLTLGWTGQLAADRGGTGMSEAGMATGDVLYSPDGSSWDGLTVGAANNVLRSNGTIPGWGKVTSSYTTGTFPPDSHAYSTHSGTVPLADLGGAVLQAILRADTAGTAWEAYSGSTIGRVLKLTAAAENAVWAEGQVTAAEITNGAALSRTNDTNVTVTLGGNSSTCLLAAASLALGWSGTLAASRGGLGFAANAIGSIIWNIDGTSWTQLQPDASGNFYLKSTDRVLSWSSAVGDADTLDGQHGSYYRNASNVNAGSLSLSYLGGTPADGNILIDDGAAGWTVGQLPIADTTGTLAIARGGTNATSQTSDYVTYFNGTSITSWIDKDNIARTDTAETFTENVTLDKNLSVGGQAYSPMQSVAVAAGETTKTVSFESGNVAKITLSNTSSVALTFSNPNDGGCYTVMLLASGAGRSFTFSSTIEWFTTTPSSPLGIDEMLILTLLDGGGPGFYGFASQSTVVAS